MIFHGILIYEIARHIKIFGTTNNYMLTCTFPKGIGSIYMKLIWVLCDDQPEKVFKLELDPETSIEVPVPFNS